MFVSHDVFSKLVGSLYDAADDPALWTQFLGDLSGHVQATSAALLIHDFKHATYSLSSSWQMSPESLTLYTEHYHALDVWAKKGLSKPSGYVCNSQSLCPLEEIRSTEIYNDFMVKAGIEHGAFAVLNNNESCLASVSLYRDNSLPEFTRADVSTLQLLAPHLQRAFHLHLRFSELKAHAAGIETAFDLFPNGIIFLDSRGEIVLMNRSAAAITAEKDGLQATRAGLRAERSGESALLTSTIQQATATSNGRGDLPRGTVLISRRNRPPLRLFITPIHNSVIPAPRHIAVAVFVSDPLRVARPALDVLRAQFRLTPAECRVALLLSDGHAPREIASMIGVTDHTVRSQIKSIFSKTGVKRQGQLVRLLLSNQAFQTGPQALG